MFRAAFGLNFVIWSVTGAVCSAADWPQWMGPKRDGVWRETGVVRDFVRQPEVTWRTKIAGGYSGPAVANGRVFVTDYVRSLSLIHI